MLRAQVFAGDALSHVAFTGALAAAAAGIDMRIGLFAATIAVALMLGGIGERSRADDVTIGIIFAWILGLGVFFLALFSTGSGGGNGLLGARALFGSIFGLSASDAALAALIAARDRRRACSRSPGRCCSRASTPPSRPRAACPSARSGCCFSRCSAPTTAEATQAVGALLLLGLLAAPAGAAQRLTANPYLALGLSAAIAVLCDVGRPDAQLRDPEPTAEHGDHRSRHRHLPARVSDHQRPAPRPDPAELMTVIRGTEN